MKTSNYVLLKRCVNCGTNNFVGSTSCIGCKLLLIGEITFDEWTELNKKLGDIAEQKAKEKKRKKIEENGGFDAE